MMRVTRALTLLLCLDGIAFAICDQSAASQADRDLWNAHGGCIAGYYGWHWKAYDIRSDEWSNRGYFDACNLNKEYAKHWNAAYLITFGLPDASAQNPRVTFHSVTDYQGTAIAADNVYHDDLYHAPTDDPSIYGRWSWRPFGPNRVETSCGLYDAWQSHANPASRGGDFIHEGWHGYLWEYWYWPDHYSGPRGNCTLSGNACDYFYFHSLSQYPFGNMWYSDGTSNWFHSPNQVQLEYLCDIATAAKSWVPLSVRTAAAADANVRAVQRFINGPAIRCSAPTPIVGYYLQ